jgi:hypothetical protein
MQSSLRQTPRQPSELQTAKQSFSQWLPGQNANDPPLILEEGVRFPPASKEAVPVTFICNLRGFGCPLSANTISPSPWCIDCKLAKEECELVPSHEMCTTQEPGQAMGSPRFKTNRQRQKCMKTNNLPHGLGVLRGLPQPTPALSFLRCA